MRIAVGMHSMLLGGSQINTIDLAVELRERGHHVDVFVLDPHERTSSIQPVADEAGVVIHRLPPDGPWRVQARRVAEFLAEHRSDVLHVYHEDGHLGPVGALATARQSSVSLVVTNWMMEHTSWLPRHAHLIVGFYRLEREARRVRPGPVHVIEPPVNIDRDRYDGAQASEFRAAWGIADDDIVALIACRIDREMKFDSVVNAIRAVEQVGDDRLRLVIVGDGDALDTIRSCADETNRRLGRPAVISTGLMTDPRSAYSAADLVLGMGGSAIRALAFAKPLVVLGLGSFSIPFSEQSLDYVLEHGFFGECDSPTDGTRLAVHIREQLDAERRAELAHFGVEVVNTRFGLDPLTTRLEAVYEDARARRPGARQRWTDVGYLHLYEFVHRWFPSGIRARLRQALGRMV